MWVGLVGLFIVGMLGGFTPVAIKFGVREFPPLLLTTLRFVVAAIVLFPFFLKQQRNVSRFDIWFLFTRSLFFAGNVGLFSIAIQYTTAIVAQILYTLVPIIVLVMSYVFLKEKITISKILGLVIAVVGAGILLQQSIVKAEVITFGTPFGNILNLLAVFSWSYYILVSKELTKKYSPLTTTFSSFITTIVVLLLLLPVEYVIRPIAIGNVTAVGIGSILWLGIFSSAVMFLLTQVVVKKTSPFITSFSQYFGPFASALISIPLLGEKPTSILFFAGLFIFCGVFYATSYEQVRKYLKSVLQ